MSLSPSPINTNLADILDEKQVAKLFASPAHYYGSLDPKLVAIIRRVTKDGKSIHDSEKVYAILTEGDLELASQYSSPFENSNPEQRYPTLTGMLQSGDMVDSIGRVASGSPSAYMAYLQKEAASGNPLAVAAYAMASMIGGPKAMMESITNAAANGNPLGVVPYAAATGISNAFDTMKTLEGKSTFTKVNSTQIYASTQPVRLNCTLFFRAWRNAKTEVENQVQLLQEWVLPVELSKTGALENMLSPNGKGFIASLFPSTMPPFVSLTYGGKTYTPMLLESVNTPIVVERDQRGNRLALSVQCAFVSRTSWDKSDLRKL